MKKSMVMQRLFSLVLAVVLACSCFTGAFGAELDTSDAAINAAKAAMDAAKTALDAAKAELAKADANVATAEANLAAAEKALADAGVDPDAADSEAVAELKKQIEELQKQINGGAVADLTAQSTQAAADKVTNATKTAEAKSKMNDLADDVAEQEEAVKLTADKIDQINTEITNNNTKKANNETAITNANTELAGMDSQLALLAQGITDAEAAVKALQNLQTTLQTEQTELADLEKQLENEEAALENKEKLLTDEKTAQAEKETELGNKLTELQTAQGLEEAAQKTLDAAKLTKAEAEAELPSLYAQKAELEEKIAVATEEAKALSGWDAIKKLGEVADLGVDLGIVEGKIALATRSEIQEAIDKADAALNEKKAETATALAAWNKANDELETAKQAVAAAQQAIADQKQVIANKEAEITTQSKVVEEALAEVNAALAGTPEEQKAAAQKKYDEYAASIETRRAELETKVKTLTEENKDIVDANKFKADEITALKDTKATQEAALAETQAALETATAAYNDLVKAGEAIDAEIARIAAEIEKITTETIPVLQKQLEDLQKQLENAQTGDDKLLAEYTAAKAALETAKATQYTLALGVPALQIAYDEAASLYAQLTGSTSCAHDKYQVEAFGNVFCPLKTIGLCTHNLGKCCSSMSTSMISNRINEYIAAGDYKGLAAEVKSLYNQLSNLVNAYEEMPESSREAISSAVNALVNKAADAVGEKLLGEQNWAMLKELANVLQNPAEIEAKVQAIVDEAVAEAKAAINDAVFNGDFTALKNGIAKAEALVEKVSPYFQMVGIDLSEIKNQVAGAAKQYLDQIKDQIANSELNKIADLVKKAEAKINELKNQLPGYGDLEALLNQFKNEVGQIVNSDYAQYLAQLKSELAAKIKDCVNNGKMDKLAELAKNIIAKADALKDKLPTCGDVENLIDAFKFDVNALINGGYKQYVEQIKDALMEQIEDCIDKGKLEKAAELIKKAIEKLEELKDQLPIDEEIQKLIDALKIEAKEFINGGYKQYAAAAKEQIKAALQKVLDDECYSYIAAKAAELQSKVEKLLSEIHVCEESAEEVAKLVKTWVEEFINDCTAYIEAKLDAVTCESIKAELKQIADAIENALDWRPDCDLTEEDIKAIIDALKEMAKECIKDKAEIIEGLIEEILKHITVVLPAVEPTCYQTGLTEGLACICGKHIYIEQEIIPATGNHVYCEGEVTTEPTCITPGEKTFHCETEGCVASYTESIPTTGEHMYCEGEVTTEPTCITPGVKTFHCEADENCTATKTETIAATGEHVYESEIVDEATCCADGTIRYYCVADENCDAGYSQIIPATGEHVYEAVTTEPTCGADGKIVYTCTTEGCGDSYEEIIPATGEHVYVAVTTEATCCADGKIVYTCVCGATYEEVIPATGKHVYDAGVVTTEATCYTDGVKTFTCTTEGCKASYTEVIPATGEHNWVKVDSVESTCTTGGKKYYECSTKGCPATKTVETGRKGHSFGEWISNQNGTHSTDCQRWCGYVATVKCAEIEAVLAEELTMIVCPVCGDYLDASFELVADAAIEAVEKNALPQGKAVVRGMEAPVDGVLYAFTAAYERSGKVSPFNGTVSVTLPLDEEITEFKVIRVIAEADAEKDEELQVEITYTLEDGKLTVETDDAALFLLVPIA